IVLRTFEAMFKSWLRAYEWSLDRVLRYKAVTLVITLATLGLAVWLYVIVPKGFFPTEDTGFISASTEGGSDISFQGMVDLQRQVAEIIRSDPAVDYVNSPVRAGGRNPTTNIGRMFIALKSRSERHENSTEVIQRLRNSANTVPGMAVYFQNVQNINITAAFPRASTSTRCSPATPNSSMTWRRNCATGSPRSRGCATSPLTSTSRIRR